MKKLSEAQKSLLFLLLSTLALAALFLLSHHASAEPYQGEYHSLEEIQEELERIHANYPNITALYNLSHYYDTPLTHKGRALYALKISDNPEKEEEDEVDVLIVGATHGREWISYEVPLYFIHSILENYTSSTTDGGEENDTTEYLNRAHYLINNREIWVIPVVNPDGVHKSLQRNDRQNNWTGWRKNLRDNNQNGKEDYRDDGVDLNRNYGYKWGYDDQGSSPDPSSQTYRGPAPWSEAETQMIRALVEDEKHDFKTALTYHSYGEMILYPYGYQPLDPEHFDQYLTIAREMAYWNGYRYGNYKSGLIYKTNGDMIDYLYGEHKIISYTIELGSDRDRFIPDESRIVPISKENLELNYFIAEVAPVAHNISIFINCESFGWIESKGEGWHLSESENESFGGEKAWKWSEKESEAGKLPSSLVTGEFTISSNTVLSFWQKYDFGEGAWGFVSVEKNHDGHWRKIIPVEGYPAKEEGRGLVFKGRRGWHLVSFDLSPFVGEKDERGEAEIRLRFTASGKGRASSFWCVDDISFYKKNLGLNYNFEFDLELNTTHYFLEKDEHAKLLFKIKNLGNTMNSLKIRIGEREKLEENGLVMELSDDFLSLEPGEAKMVELSFYSTSLLSFEEQLYLKIKVISDFSPYPEKRRDVELRGKPVVDTVLSSQRELFSVLPGRWIVINLSAENKGNLNLSAFSLGFEFLNPSKEDELWQLELARTVVLNASEKKNVSLRVNVSTLLPYPKEKRVRVYLNFSEEETLALNSGKNLSGLTVVKLTVFLELSLYLEKYRDGCFEEIKLEKEMLSPAKDNKIFVTVLNTGNVESTYLLSLNLIGGGTSQNWIFKIFENEEMKNTTTIKSFQKGEFEMIVTPPEDAKVGDQVEFSLELYLYNEEGERYRLVDKIAVTLRAGESYFFEVEVEEGLKEEYGFGVVPGRNYSFHLTVLNKGNTKNSFVFSTNLGEDWHPFFSFNEMVVNQKTPLKVAAGEKETVEFHITIPENLAFSLFVPFEIKVKSLGDGSEDSVFSSFEILKYYNISVFPSGTTVMTVEKGKWESMLVVVKNNGNAQCEVSLSLIDVPEGWGWRFRESKLIVPAGKEKVTELEVFVPREWKKSEGSIKIKGVTGDAVSGFAEDEIELSLNLRMSKEEKESSPNFTLFVLVAVVIGVAGFVVFYYKK